MPFTLYDPDQHDLKDLVNALIPPTSGITVLPDSINLKYGILADGDTSISFYDGTLGLGVGPGLFLSSGTGNPPLSNTQSSYSGSFSQTIGYSGTGDSVDAQLQQVAQDAFAGAGNITDATILEFEFEVTEENVKSMQLSFMFGSEEYPNFVDSSYVDIGAILVNGKNYALFGGNEDQPLSIIGANLSAANFNQNHGEYLPQVPPQYADAGIVTVEWPIEFNAVSNPLSVVIPVEQGLNTIKIGVADTGDKIYDSGLFVSGLQGVGQILDQDYGIIVPLTKPTEFGQNPFLDWIFGLPFEVVGDPFAFWTQDGVQHYYGTKEKPLDAYFDFSVSEIQGFDLMIDSDGKTNHIAIQTDQLNQKYIHVHKMVFSDFAAAMDTWEGAPAWKTFSLLQVVFGMDPSPTLFTEWYLKALEADNYCKPTSHLAGVFLDHYGLSDIPTQDLVGYMYFVLTGAFADDATVDMLVNVYAGLGQTSNAEILGFTADNLADTSKIAEFLIPLDLSMVQMGNDMAMG